MSNPSALPPPPPGVQFVDDADALPPPPPGVTFNSPSTTAAGGSWTPNVGQEIEQSKLGQAHPTLAKIAGIAANSGAGVLKGAGQLLGGLDNTAAGRWLNSYGGLRSPAATQAATSAYQRLTTPNGQAQRLAAGATNLAGNVAEGVALPEAEGGVLARMAAQGLMGAGLSKINGGSATAGAAGGALAEGAGSALRAVAPRIAEAALHVGGADRAYGKTPGVAMLEHTRGNTLAKIAQTAREALGTTGARIGEIADTASVPSIEYAPNRRLTLPPGPTPEPIPIPLHDATAVVDRPSGLQPAAENRFGAPVTLRQPQIEITVARDPATGRMASISKTIDPGTNPPRLPQYSTSAASSLIPEDPTWRLPAEQGAADFLDRLHAEGDNGVTYPLGHMNDGAVNHPLKTPLRTTRTTESAQGVWLRTPEGPIEIGPTTPAQAGFTLHRPTVSLRPALDRLDSMIARVPRNNPTALKALQRVRAALTEDMAGNAIPENVPPSLALELKQGMRREFAKYRGDPALDFNTASNASKGASRDIDHVLDEILGPEFTNLNQRYSSLKTVEKLADRGSRGAPMSQRVVHRVAAHTGALAGAGVGSVLGYEKGGVRGAAGGAAAGLLLPEVLAGSPTLVGLARRAYAPATKRLLRGALVGGATASTK